MVSKVRLADRTQVEKQCGYNRRELRIAAGLTQKELAIQCNVSRATVINWEAGFPMFALHALRLAKVLKVDLTELIEDYDDDRSA